MQWVLANGYWQIPIRLVFLGRDLVFIFSKGQIDILSFYLFNLQPYLILI